MPQEERAESDGESGSLGEGAEEAGGHFESCKEQKGRRFSCEATFEANVQQMATCYKQC